MWTETARQDTRKAMAYDIIQREKPEKQSYTAEEIKKSFHVYLSAADQK